MTLDVAMFKKEKIEEAAGILIGSSDYLNQDDIRFLSSEIVNTLYRYIQNGRIISDNSKICDVVEFNESNTLSKEDLINILVESQSLLTGHFELLSKRHSSIFLAYSKIASMKNFNEVIGKELLTHIENQQEINAVIGPATAGSFIVKEIAKLLNIRPALTDVLNGKPIESLKIGSNVQKNENIIIVNDLITSGEGIKIIHKIIKSMGAKLKGIYLFAERVNKLADQESILNKIKSELSCDGYALVQLNVQDYNKGECPLCGKFPLLFSKGLNY